MKKLILTIAILSVVLAGRSQSKEFTTAMSEGLTQFAKCKTIDDYQALGNRFSLIANAEKAEWLPLYYHAHCYILMSFMESADATKKDSYLDVAEKSISKMIELAPKESEVYVLQSMMYSARLVVNPMERGQEYGGLIMQSIGIARGLDSTNPRAKFMKLKSDMGTAEFFGKSPKDFCPQATEILAGWDNYKVKSRSMWRLVRMTISFRWPCSCWWKMR
ncbi:MAG: hypothetical protein PHY99_10300 [Bacteroidales bacterium]|nr:hypothetical protein [Bacteroidales bacterium]